MGGVVATNTIDDVCLFLLSFFPFSSGYPVFLPSSGTAIDIRDVDACYRNSSRASELVICIYGRFFLSKHGVGRIEVVTNFFHLPAIFGHGPNR